MYIRGYDLNFIVKRVKGAVKRYNTLTKALNYLFNRKNSLLRSYFIYMTVRGYSELHICKLTNIPYKSYRYYIDKHNDVLRYELNKARSLRSTWMVEKNVRKVNTGIGGSCFCNKRGAGAKCAICLL